MKMGSSVLVQEQERWVPRKGAECSLGKSMVQEDFHEEVVSELCFEW